MNRASANRMGLGLNRAMQSKIQLASSAPSCVGFNHETDRLFQRRSFPSAMRCMYACRCKCWIKANENLAGFTSPRLQQR